MLFAPLEGWREVKVTERRTAIDYAHVLKDVSDLHFKNAEKIVLVQDNLNTHSPASLYEAFPPPRHDAWSSVSNGTTPPSMAAGWTWPSPSWLFWPLNVSIDVSKTRANFGTGG